MLCLESFKLEYGWIRKTQIWFSRYVSCQIVIVSLAAAPALARRFYCLYRMGLVPVSPVWSQRPDRSLSVALALSAHRTPPRSRSSRIRRREKLANIVTHPLYSSFYLWWLNFFHACIKFTYPFIAGNVFSLLLILFGQDTVMIPQVRILVMSVDIIN